MTRETDTLTILFADIAKSTRLYEEHGDRSARYIIGIILGLLREAATRFGGTVIKTIGDEVMCTFPTAQAAVDSAVEMHQSLDRIQFEEMPEVVPPNIYVGLHYGPVIRDSGDIFGVAANTAARMVTRAKQRQIITTGETVGYLPPGYRDVCHRIDNTTIKGRRGKIDIYEVIWEQQDATLLLDNDINGMTLPCCLELTFSEHVLIVDDARPTATLGRQLHNDIVVNDGRVSRSHARIEYRRGKFVLIDQSSNGTFVAPQGDEAIHLVRDETVLADTGVIGLGRDAGSESPMAVRYAVKTTNRTVP